VNGCPGSIASALARRRPSASPRAWCGARRRARPSPWAPRPKAASARGGDASAARPGEQAGGGPRGPTAPCCPRRGAGGTRRPCPPAKRPWGSWQPAWAGRGSAANGACGAGRAVLGPPPSSLGCAGGGSRGAPRSGPAGGGARGARGGGRGSRPRVRGARAAVLPPHRCGRPPRQGVMRTPKDQGGSPYAVLVTTRPALEPPPWPRRLRVGP
jgi:hypothetical protein